MRTILIILSALGAAILVLNILKIWQRRLAERRGEVASDRMSVIHLISAAVGLAVFFLAPYGLSQIRHRRDRFMHQQRLRVAP